MSVQSPINMYQLFWSRYQEYGHVRLIFGVGDEVEVKLTDLDGTLSWRRALILRADVTSVEVGFPSGLLMQLRRGADEFRRPIGGDDGECDS